MLTIRNLAIGTAVSILLVASVPSMAFAAANRQTGLSETPAAEHTAAPDPSHDPVSVHDPDRDSEVAVEVTGQLVVGITEPLPSAGAGAPQQVVQEFAYGVRTAGGDTIPIDVELPETVEEGDLFVGTVTIPPSVIDELRPLTVVALESADSDGVAIAEDTLAAEDIFTVASANSVTLPVAQGEITATADVAQAGVAQQHRVTIVVMNPTSAAPLSYADSQIAALVDSATSFWSTSSNGLITSFTSTDPIRRFSSSAPCGQNAFSRWDEAASRLGFANAGAFEASAPAGVSVHLVVILPPGCQSIGVGVGTIGGGLHSGGLTQVTLGVGVDRQVIAHEIGHNLSLGHSNLDYCTTGSAVTGCTEYEYGDYYDVMGIALGGWDSKLTALNSRSRVALGFVTVPAQYRYTLGTSVQTATWNLNLAKLGSSTGQTVAEVVDPLTSEVYYIEYRGGESGTAFYAQGYTVAFAGSGAPKVAMQSGVRILRSSSDNGSIVETTADMPGGDNRTAAWMSGGTSNASGSIRVTVSGGSESAGAAITITATAHDSNSPQPVYRFWSPSNRTHFFTSDIAEVRHILDSYPPSVWTFEGARFTAFTTQLPGTVPLYRFWSPDLHGHFFTIDEAEKESVIANYPDRVWTFEGTAFYVYPLDSPASNTDVVHRFWSPTNQHHFYTSSSTERDAVINDYPDSIWTYEGEGYRVPAGG
jgi:Repeat of unknown function (DUF5648)